MDITEYNIDYYKYLNSQFLDMRIKNKESHGTEKSSTHKANTDFYRREKGATTSIRQHSHNPVNIGTIRTEKSIG